jgi:hypothetical protein
MVRARAAEKRTARLAQLRATIVAAVRECTEMLGRPPGATEFFAWRARYSPDLPCHATVYRAFPGGWGSIMAALPADAPLAPREPLQPLA